MRRRIMFWGIVCCGLVGAMLVAGTAGAERDQDRDDDHDTPRGGLVSLDERPLLELNEILSRSSTATTP